MIFSSEPLSTGTWTSNSHHVLPINLQLPTESDLLMPTLGVLHQEHLEQRNHPMLLDHLPHIKVEKHLVTQIIVVNNNNI